MISSKYQWNVEESSWSAFIYFLSRCDVNGSHLFIISNHILFIYCLLSVLNILQRFHIALYVFSYMKLEHTSFPTQKFAVSFFSSNRKSLKTLGNKLNEMINKVDQYNLWNLFYFLQKNALLMSSVYRH